MRWYKKIDEGSGTGTKPSTLGILPNSAGALQIFLSCHETGVMLGLVA
jgi:hypothetical protein